MDNDIEGVVFFTKHFKINKSQSELDFVNIPLNRDIPLFIDPFALSQRIDRWSITAHLTLIGFFQLAVDNIVKKRRSDALYLFSHLHEPNETRLGYSKEEPQGAGFGDKQAIDLFDALSKSRAVKTGFIQNLEECELMIEGIDKDKISDLTTNVIRRSLADYTLDQCRLHGINTTPSPLPPYFSIEQNSWINCYYDLPQYNGDPILLVPKVIVRYKPSYNHDKYYRQFVLHYLQSEHISSRSSLVRTLRDGTPKVYKKDIEEIFPKTKENIFIFSKSHPTVLQEYRDFLIELEEARINQPITQEDEIEIAKILIKALQSIDPGTSTASTYHNLMIGILEFLFFPYLIHPMKEKEINEGRKRIDILMENGAKSGIFNYLPSNRQYPCAFIAFECKNYSDDIENPELDQMIGRFSTNRGKIGFICCRKLKDPTLFNRRCIDTFVDQQGLVIYLDDFRIEELLTQIKNHERQKIDDCITRYINNVWLA